jgi:hypothetical protein
MAEITTTEFSAEQIISRISWIGIVIACLGIFLYIYAADLSRLTLAGTGKDVING